MTKIEAPWNKDQVESLQGYQTAGHVHEFTGEGGCALIPNEAGWSEVQGGIITQTWAWDFMLDWSWKEFPHPQIKVE